MAKAPEQIRSLARGHTATAINVLAGIMNQPDAAPAARVSAAQALLDRGWGKPVQALTHTELPLEGLLDQLDGKAPDDSGEAED
jgi:hypothetical protein